MGVENIYELWRIFRIVSHERRLKLLWLLFEVDELCVSQLMIAAEMTRPNTSIQLKTLYLAGLIRFRRKDMNVIYRAEANPRVECAQELLGALKICYEKKTSFESIVRQVTAFTHERRVEIVRALQGGALSYAELTDRCSMTTSALSRHLHKLEARKVVWGDGELYHVVQPQEQLGRTLLEIVCRKDA